MKKFAVAYIDFFDNNLIVEIVEAESWVEALSLHSPLGEFEDEYLAEICSKGFADAKTEALNGDWLFDVKEID